MNQESGRCQCCFVMLGIVFVLNEMQSLFCKFSVCLALIPVQSQQEVV